MRIDRFACLVAVAVAFASAGMGCGDDNSPAPKKDGGTAGKDGGGDAAKDGAGGTGGTGGGTADASADHNTDTSPSTDGGVDKNPDTTPATDAVIDAPPDANVTTDAPPDMHIDTAAPDTAAPDTAAPDAPELTVVDNCADVDCPDLFDMIEASCAVPDGFTCTQTAVSGADEARTVCFTADGMTLKKNFSTTSPSDGTVVDTLTVRAPGAATDCYTVQDTTATNLPEQFIFSVGGSVKGKAVVIDGNHTIFTCMANGKAYDIGGANCPGFDGVPEPGAADCPVDASCTAP